MIILTANNITLHFGVNEIFNNISFRVDDMARIGLVGSNGAGKSSLLKILGNMIEQTSGTITKKGDMSIQYLSQISHYDSSMTVMDEVMSVFEHVFDMEKQMRDLEHAMAEANSDEFEKLSIEYTLLTDGFEDAGGYALERNARSILAGLNIGEDMHTRDMSTLSGGQRARVALGAALLRAPDLLMLDEPTNHLDLDAIRFLENYLRQYKKAFIVVSHDRYFMDEICGEILEMSMGALDRYKGNYSNYIQMREERYAQRLEEYEANQSLIQNEEAIIARYRKWGRKKSLRAAKSREKRLEKIERVDRPETENSVKFRFQIARRSGGDVMRCEDIAKSFDGNEIFSNIDMHIRSGEKIALVGSNGIGKTTLLKILNSKLEPDDGAFLLGAGVSVGYYDQHQENLNINKTAIDEVWDSYLALTHQQVRDTLALFLFRGDDIEKPISALSGGERSRLSLLKLMLSNANFLMLDEPTNHLDMDSREVLEEALQDFPGTLLFVSHDRYFINNIADRVLHMERGSMTSYEGNWDDYTEHLSQKKKLEIEDNTLSKTERSRQYKQSREKQSEKKNKRLHLEAVEKHIERLEKEIQDIEEKLASPDSLDSEEIHQLSLRHNTINDELNENLEKWETVSQ